MNIQFIGTHFPEGMLAPQPTKELLSIQEKLYRLLGTSVSGSASEKEATVSAGPWAGAWRNV